jgi:8-oxo-dGTP diphosphatase
VARAQVQAAGGIVLRRDLPPRVAVVRLRKRDEWVLPKGKLDQGETPRAAARREVLEETGHNVTVREFLGTLVYETGGRAKVVHYWNMEANGDQTRELMSDIRAVDWLPLNAAVERLSRGHERAFLEAVGPLAIGAHTRRLKAKAIASAEAAARKAQGSGVVPESVPIAPAADEPSSEAASEMAAADMLAESDVARMGVEPDAETNAIRPVMSRRRKFAQKVRRWLGRGAS